MPRETVTGCIVFDATDTLITPEPNVSSHYYEVGKRFGSELSEPEIQQQFKAAVAWHFGRPAMPVEGPATDEANERRRWYRIVRDTLTDLSDDAVSTAFETLWDRFSKPEAWRLFDDVPPALEWIAQHGFGIAVASNFDSRLLTILQALAPTIPQERVLISAHLGWSKPDPRFYRAAADVLNRQPTRLCMIGDDALNDVDAARAAGWHACRIDRQAEQNLKEVVQQAAQWIRI